ncbi:MAG: hypothetical protein J0H30_09835 [Alphaproteobacteria bacterium]|jgi:hypothetical protein|nr:hypothetical protein [Alphaproteobacteria bacterium]MBN9566129.1 hypothetical protein [Alphaproteobacteria bacterium]MBN9571327.1 hypothetical protein [Alphaproteobacteria bacterium]
MKRRSTFCKRVQTPDWKIFGAIANGMLAAYDNSAALASASRPPYHLGNFRPKKPFAYRRSHKFRPAFPALAWLRQCEFPHRPISAANRPSLSHLHSNSEFVHKNGDFMHLRRQRACGRPNDAPTHKSVTRAVQSGKMTMATAISEQADGNT